MFSFLFINWVPPEMPHNTPTPQILGWVWETIWVKTATEMAPTHILNSKLFASFSPYTMSCSKLAPTAPGGRKPGQRNIDKDTFLNVVEGVLPTSPLEWGKASTRYHEASGDSEPRDPDSMKRYFNEKLCHGDKKPTGKAGDM